jgi:hypothetical protein
VSSGIGPRQGEQKLGEHKEGEPKVGEPRIEQEQGGTHGAAEVREMQFTTGESSYAFSRKKVKKNLA